MQCLNACCRFEEITCLFSMDSNYNMCLVYFSDFEYVVLWFSKTEFLVTGQREQRDSSTRIISLCWYVYLLQMYTTCKIILNRMRFTKREAQSTLHVQAIVCEDLLTRVLLDNSLDICFSSESRFFFFVPAEIALGRQHRALSLWPNFKYSIFSLVLCT